MTPSLGCCCFALQAVFRLNWAIDIVGGCFSSAVEVPGYLCELCRIPVLRARALLQFCLSVGSPLTRLLRRATSVSAPPAGRACICQSRLGGPLTPAPPRRTTLAEQPSFPCWPSLAFPSFLRVFWSVPLGVLVPSASFSIRLSRRLDRSLLYGNRSVMLLPLLPTFCCSQILSNPFASSKLS